MAASCALAVLAYWQFRQRATILLNSSPNISRRRRQSLQKMRNCRAAAALQPLSLDICGVGAKFPEVI
jgi:hypothetical protein